MTVVNSPYPAPQNKHDDIFLSSALKATNGGAAVSATSAAAVQVQRV